MAHPPESDAARPAQPSASFAAHSSAYAVVAQSLADGRCVLLDGGNATEIPHDAARSGLDEETWGLRALIDEPEAVEAVHRRYVAVGCDVISTNTWGLPTALFGDRLPHPQGGQPVHWMDLARHGVRVAREAVKAEGRASECAVAFSLNADLDAPDSDETVRLLSRAFADDPPDAILLETLSLVRPSLFDTVEALAGTGLPVWLSFRRCLAGPCGVFGQHWGGPEGDAFGRAARRFEQLGIDALLVNCIPPDHVDGMLSYLRDFTDLPVGAYPNLGYYTDDGWHFDSGVGGQEYAEATLRWRGEGAAIIGGCCGVGPAHLDAARARLDDLAAAEAAATAPPRPARRTEPSAAPAAGTPWTDARGRPLHPLPFPQLLAEPGVAVPDAPGLMAWRHLFDQGIGARQRCLDVGCGTGLLAVQLALNGAAHVRALDVDARAVDATLTNAFRNGVADRVSAAAIDLYPWVPEERYEVIVASLDQTPADPSGQLATHRPMDYYGRNQVDQLIAKLPVALAPEGVAYLVHLSVLSQQRTAALIAEAGLVARVATYSVAPLPTALHEAMDQIERVEELTDAYHLSVGERPAVVAYLLELRHAPGHGVGEPA